MSGFTRSVSTIFSVGMILGAGLLMLTPETPESRRRVARSPIPEPPAMSCKKQAWPNMDRKCLTWTAPVVPAQPAEQQAAPTSATATAQPSGPQSIASETFAAARVVDEPATVAPAASDPPAPVTDASTGPSVPPELFAENRLAYLPVRLAAAQVRLTDLPTITASPAVVIDEAAATSHSAAIVSGVAPAAPMPIERKRRARPKKPEPAQSKRPPDDRLDAIAVTAYTANGSRRAVLIRPTSQQDVYYYRRSSVASSAPWSR